MTEVINLKRENINLLKKLTENNIYKTEFKKENELLKKFLKYKKSHISYQGGRELFESCLSTYLMYLEDSERELNNQEKEYLEFIQDFENILEY